MYQLNDLEFGLMILISMVLVVWLHVRYVDQQEKKREDMIASLRVEHREWVSQQEREMRENPLYVDASEVLDTQKGG